MITRKQRRDLILQLVEERAIENQEQLLGLLRERGIVTTQATISRDLRDLGITKGPEGYTQVNLDEVAHAHLADLSNIIKSNVLSIQRAGTLVVIHTEPGHARPLGIKIDQTDLPQIVGTVAGDNTVFIATRTASQASEVRRLFREVARSAQASDQQQSA